MWIGQSILYATPQGATNEVPAEATPVDLTDLHRRFVAIVGWDALNRRFQSLDRLARENPIGQAYL